MWVFVLHITLPFFFSVDVLRTRCLLEWQHFLQKQYWQRSVNYETPVSFSDNSFSYIKRVKASMWMCSVHILLGISLMVLMGLTAAEPLKMAMFSPKKKLKVGALFEVGINVHMRNTLRVFFRVKTWARNPGCLIRVTLGSDYCLLMLILAPHCH